MAQLQHLHPLRSTRPARWIALAGLSLSFVMSSGCATTGSGKEFNWPWKKKEGVAAGPLVPSAPDGGLLPPPGSADRRLPPPSRSAVNLGKPIFPATARQESEDLNLISWTTGDHR
ncbi:hypothetical protein Pan216_20190 [Planctomycetes bacterium Pan216]|uniref:Uncharacterized protein n=1 Tax=Kolteria novifilia TaxID=2527975 RepID=A0A518B2G5_9BACT|nr:hypothetical protein Pan216_20190 [Planctomycetes bacterium Pan216]